MLATAIIFPNENPRHDLTALLSAMIPIYYVAVLMLRGFGQRSRQVLAAIAGSDVILTLIYLFVFFLVRTVTDEATALGIALLISFWSVPVQGHIVSRAIECHWGVGILISLILHILLNFMYFHLVKPS